MNIIIIGAKSSGKSTLGRELAKNLNINFVETDDLIERLYSKDHSGHKKCSEIFDILGEEKFRS